MNPAHELHDLLSRWKVVNSGTTILKQRQATADERETFIDQQLRACRLVGEIQRELVLLDALGEDVSSFRHFLQRWWEAVIVPNEVWKTSSQSAREVVTAETLATLRMFAQYLDKSAIRPIRVTTEGVNMSRQALNELSDVLNSRDDLIDEEREYIFWLITEVRTMLDGSDANVQIDLLRKVRELRGWLAEFEDHLERNSADGGFIAKLREIGRRILPPARTAFRTASFALGTTSDLLALTELDR